MTITVYPIDAVSGSPLYSARQAREALSVFSAGAAAADPFGVRSGVRPGTSPTTVTATSTAWTIGAHAGILDVQPAVEASGYPYAINAVGGLPTGAVTAAHATLPRVDVVWLRVDDPAETDGSSVPAVVAGYTAGTAASTPVPPTTWTGSARCMVLAWINVPASGGGSPTVTWKAPYCVAAGALIPVWSQTERDALVLRDGLSVYRLDLHSTETYSSDLTAWTGGAWVTYTPTLTNFTLGTGSMSVQYRREGIDLVRVRYFFTLCTGSMSDPKFSLPFTSIALRTTFEVVGFGVLAIGGARYASVADLGTTTQVGIHYLGVNGAMSNVTMTAPATWANWDTLAGEFTYRAA